jgi:hypothetical protein
MRLRVGVQSKMLMLRFLTVIVMAVAMVEVVVFGVLKKE